MMNYQPTNPNDMKKTAKGKKVAKAAKAPSKPKTMGTKKSK